MTEDRDEFITRVADALRPLPAVNGEARARVLLAVATERERDRDGETLVLRRPRPWKQWLTSAACVAAGIMWLFVMRNPSETRRRQSVAHRAAPASAPAVQLAAHDPNAVDVAPIPVQLVFRAPAASRVAIVGDFNGWNKDKDFMVRDDASGLWSMTLSVRPGRHVYAFVVNDTQWVRDPRAVAAPDADFGRPGSVLLVTKP